MSKFSKHKQDNSRFSNSSSNEDVLSSSVKKMYSIDINLIIPNPYQPRLEIDDLEDLKSSISKLGLIQPLSVTKPNADGKYTIIYGHRRLQALKELGYDDVQVLIEENSNKNLRLKALAENSQRKDLDFLELAFVYKDIIKEYKYTYDELSLEINKSKTYIAQVLSILKLNDDVLVAIKDDKYNNLGVLHKLNQVDTDLQYDVYNEIKALSRDEALKYIDTFKEQKIKPISTPISIQNKNGNFKININVNDLNEEQKKQAVSELYKLIKLIKNDKE